QGRERKCRHGGAGAGYAAYLYALLSAGYSQVLARVRDYGHARVRDESAVLAGEDALDYALAAALLIVLVVAHEGLRYAEVVQKLERHARVLSGNEVRLLERAARPGREVAEVAYGRTYECECSCHQISSLW